MPRMHAPSRLEAAVRPTRSKPLGSGRPFRRLGLAMAVVSVWLAAVGVSSPTQADPWPWIGINGAGYQVVLPKPDLGPNHTYCLDPKFAPADAVETRIHSSMAKLEATTDVEVAHHGCTSATDVRWQQRHIAVGVLGQVNCRSGALSSGVCGSWRVRIAWGEIRFYATNDNYEARHTICHELGHTVALNHYGPNNIITSSPDAPAHSCMRSGVWDSGAVEYKSYGADHRAHINAYFP